MPAIMARISMRENDELFYLIIIFSLMVSDYFSDVMLTLPCC